ncbi:N-acetyl sugar amidotransferase [Flavobacteriaceae bacterium]|nr:N-acetyl sugar amidotransferase [Flavobacteriaceae bacterium]|tara:strand:+ start:645 stop:1784 length:1140 start_codon:yes stop_codon:yes gene_type:complete
MALKNQFKIKYCKKLLIPDSRPGVIIDENGISNVWKDSLSVKEIDWEVREKSFKKLVEFAKSKSKGYDCLVPVSGGKDSTWQIVKCLEYGLNVLAVTWKTPSRTQIGQKNLDNLISLGVDHIDYQINPIVEKKFVYKSFCKYGTTALPMHMALFSIPLKIAIKLDIPVVVWGENSAAEYGTSDDAFKGSKMDLNWIKRFGVTHGTTAKDWISKDLTKEELTPYFAPTESEIHANDLRAVFLGHYFKWDPETSLEVASKNGFLKRKEGPKTGYYNYADIDDDFISIHHFIKWYKFGFTRLFDNLAIEIKKGRMNIDDAKKIILKNGIQEPTKDIIKFCNYMGITKDHFYSIVEKFRDPKVWTFHNGKWIINNFPIENWKW